MRRLEVILVVLSNSSFSLQSKERLRYETSTGALADKDIYYWNSILCFSYHYNNKNPWKPNKQWPLVNRRASKLTIESAKHQIVNIWLTERSLISIVPRVWLQSSCSVFSSFNSQSWNESQSCHNRYSDCNCPCDRYSRTMRLVVRKEGRRWNAQTEDLHGTRQANIGRNTAGWWVRVLFESCSFKKRSSYFAKKCISNEGLHMAPRAKSACDNRETRHACRQKGAMLSITGFAFLLIYNLSEWQSMYRQIPMWTRRATPAKQICSKLLGAWEWKMGKCAV